MKSKLIKALIACVVVVGISGGGYYGYKKVFAAKQVTAPTARSITVAARKMNLQVNVQGTGAAYSSNTKEVMPGNNGNIKDLSFKIGDTVTAGQKLFVSDSDDVRQAVTTAQNNLNDANLNLTSAQNELTASQKDLSDAEAAASTAASTNSQSSDTSKSNNNQSNSSQGTKSVDSLKLQVQRNQASVEQAKLKVTAAKDKLTSAKDAVGKMTVTAPIAGVITAVNLTNGDSAQQNKAVLTIVDMSAIRVKVAVDELDIEKIKLGQKSEVKFDAIKNKTYEGTVETIAQEGKSTNNVTTYDVVVAITNSEGIKLGMNANVNILVENKENALVIPAEALVEMNGKRYVRVENSEGNTGTQGTGTNQAATGTPANNQVTANSQGAPAPSGSATTQSGKNNNANNSNKSAKQAARTNQRNTAATTTNTQNVSVGKLVEIKTGLENENYIEVLEGVTEGQKLLVALPQTSTTNNNQNQGRNAMGSFGGGAPSGAQGGFPRN
ncbi:efflux RND transporter periplasmic adaptor subunit [Clostridium swellfunianum]|uniref:efflux RND transporter periplasmic adaptor subunit n=1 Tax=Clostridium swellfunianum TaxID=1367462 RepID=UPI00202F0762|nr:efflux RND transporter periplasmic adaptor subunit [Clostridium swellfunianum]MCM0650859.1 efflux RND transporter periplasmic adaptor subunit [Clostridium swellfunianum]